MKKLIGIFAMIVIANVVNAQSAFDQLMAKKADALVCALKANAQATQDVKVSIDKQTEAISTGILLTGQYQEKDLALKEQSNKIGKTANLLKGAELFILGTGVAVDIVSSNNTINAIDRLTSTVAQNQVQPYRPWVTNQGRISSYGGYVDSQGQQFVSNGITAGNPGISNTGTVGGGYYDVYGVWHP
jgi:hypothetical protein